MKKRILILVVALSLGFMQGGAFAEMKGPHGKRMDEMSAKEKFFKKVKMIYMNKDALAISDKQLDQINDLKTDLKKDLIRKKADIEIIAVDIKSLMYEHKMDLKAINKLIDEKYEIKKAKAKKTVAACAKLREILSKEQMEDLKKSCMKMHKMHGGK